MVGEVAQIQDIEEIVKTILNYAVRLAGIAAFVMLIVGGFKYLTAGGDPKKAEAAQKTITYAVFGLVFLIGGWFILKLIQEFTGVPVTEFSIIPTEP